MRCDKQPLCSLKIKKRATSSILYALIHSEILVYFNNSSFLLLSKNSYLFKTHEKMEIIRFFFAWCITLASLHYRVFGHEHLDIEKFKLLCTILIRFKPKFGKHILLRLFT